MGKRGEIGRVGGGSLEHPRRWLGTQGLGAQWPGLALGVLSCPEPPGVPCAGTGAELGHCQVEHFTVTTMLRGLLLLGEVDLLVVLVRGQPLSHL